MLKSYSCKFTKQLEVGNQNFKHNKQKEGNKGKQILCIKHLFNMEQILKLRLS